MSLLIKNARIIDPVNAFDDVRDLWVDHQTICDAQQKASQIIDAKGLWLMPGLIDLCARVGLSKSERIQGESKAAIASGISCIVTPPDDGDPLEHPAQVRDALQRIKISGNGLNVLPTGALTKGLHGEALADMHSLLEAGCIGLSNARQPIADSQVMHCAMEYINSLPGRLFLSSQDPWLAANGCAHAGRVSSRLGLKGIPTAAETVALARDLALIEHTGTQAHFGRLSSASSAALIKRAQANGLSVSADVAMHQLFLSDMDLVGFDPRFRTDPPLRTQTDRDSLRDALSSGVIQAICSDHKPLGLDAKVAPFPASQAGVSGLETLLPLGIRLVQESVLTPLKLAERMYSGPAEILGLPTNGLESGRPASFILIDPDYLWTVKASEFISRGKFSPFEGWQLSGQLRLMMSEGEILFQNPE